MLKLDSKKIHLLSAMQNKDKNKFGCIWIEPTLRCNANCRMCLRKELVGNRYLSPEDDLSFEDFKKIISKIPYPILRIHLQGNGEPFLNKDIFEMIKYCVSKNIVVGITSNGTLINEEISKKIIDSGLDFLGISIDAIDKEFYEELRPGYPFKSLLNNLETLMSVKSKTKADLLVAMYVVVTEHNKNDLDRFLTFAHQFGFDGFVYQPLSCKPIFTESYDKDFYNNNVDILTHRLGEIIDIKKIQSHAESLGIYGIPAEKCVMRWKDLYITFDGYVTPCCFIPATPMGNIFTQDFDEVWNGRKFKEFKQKILEHKLPEQCKDCPRELDFDEVIKVLDNE